MTTELDIEFAEIIPELIAEFGKTVVFKIADQTYDPEEGDTEDTNPDTFSLQIIPPDKMMEKYLGTTTVDEGQMAIGLGNQGLAFTPYKGMLVTIDSEDWKLDKIVPIYTGDLIGLFMLVLER